MFFLDDLTRLHKTNKSKLAETVRLNEQPVPGPNCPGDTQAQEPEEESQASQNSGQHPSPEDLLKQRQEEDCKAMMMQHLAQTVRFTDVKHGASGSEVGQMLCGNSTINEFQGGYKGQLKRAFIFDCVSLPEARKRPWRQAPRESTEVKDRLTGIVTFIEAGFSLVFFDAGMKENAYMCHEVSITALRSCKKLN